MPDSDWVRLAGRLLLEFHQSELSDCKCRPAESSVAEVAEAAEAAEAQLRLAALPGAAFQSSRRLP